MASWPSLFPGQPRPDRVRSPQKLVQVLEHRGCFDDLRGSDHGQRHRTARCVRLRERWRSVREWRSMCIDTGRLSWTSIAVDVEEEELRADLATSSRSIEVPQPHKNDLGLDRDLVLECAARELPDDHEAVEECLRRTGAYGRFKRVLEGCGARETWGAYEERATKSCVAKRVRRDLHATC